MTADNAAEGQAQRVPPQMQRNGSTTLPNQSAAICVMTRQEEPHALARRKVRMAAARVSPTLPAHWQPAGKLHTSYVLATGKG